MQRDRVGNDHCDRGAVGESLHGPLPLSSRGELDERIGSNRFEHLIERPARGHPLGAEKQAPFDQLLPFNGGIDQQTGQPSIHLGITVTFYGETVAGTRVKSDPATLDIFVVAQ